MKKNLNKNKKKKKLRKRDDVTLRRLCEYATEASKGIMTENAEMENYTKCFMHFVFGTHTRNRMNGRY